MVHAETGRGFGPQTLDSRVRRVVDTIGEHFDDAGMIEELVVRQEREPVRPLPDDLDQSVAIAEETSGGQRSGCGQR
jgi:hypothetical protein